MSNRFTVIEEEISPVFAKENLKKWFAIAGPNGILSSRYLNEQEANIVASKLESEKYITNEEILKIKEKAEIKRLQKLAL